MQAGDENTEPVHACAAQSWPIEQGQDITLHALLVMWKRLLTLMDWFSCSQKKTYFNQTYVFETKTECQN